MRKSSFVIIAFAASVALVACDDSSSASDDEVPESSESVPKSSGAVPGSSASMPESSAAYFSFNFSKHFSVTSSES